MPTGTVRRRCSTRRSPKAASTAEEHSQRLDSIYAARTHADIVPLIDSLPARSEFASPALRPAGTVASGESARPIIAIFGGATRKGAWRVPQTTTVVTVFGGADIDLRYAALRPARSLSGPSRCSAAWGSPCRRRCT